MEPLEAEKQPGDPALDECDADPGIAIEDAVVDDARAIDGEAPGMAEGMDRHVHVQMVHPKAVVPATVDRQRAPEPFGLGVDRPVLLGAEGNR